MDLEQESSLDLGRYVYALRKSYRLIILCMVLVGGLALGVSFLMPPTYQSEAVVAIVKSGVEVNFDPKITTVTDFNNQGYTDPTARRKSLTTIATSPDIANAVIAKLGDQLPKELQDATALAATIVAVNDGDLIRIKATGGTPEKAALLVNTWAQEYAARVNSVYGDSNVSSPEIQTQTGTAKTDYEAKEATLITYFATDPHDQLARQIAEKQQLLAALQSGKDIAVTTVVSEELGVRSQIISQYLTTEANNRLVAFVKEQEGKSKLLTSYLDSIIASRLAVFNQQSAAKIQQLSDSYTIANKLDRLIADATALRARLASGSSGAVRGDELAGVLLETSAYSSWSNLPVNLQIPIDQLSVGSTTADQRKSLDALLASLKDRRKTVQADIDAQSQDLLSNPGYEFLDAKVFGQASVVDAVKKQYPELFAIGDLASLTDNQSADNPLAQSTDEQSRALLQLDGLEKIVTDSSTSAPMTKAMDQIQQEVNQLQSQLESESAKKQELLRARDLAWDTYTTLANKSAEVEIAAQAPGSVVRVATPGIAAILPVAQRKITNTLLGLVIGLLLGSGIALGYEFLHETVRNEDQVTRLLGLPVIGAIPEISTKLGVSVNGERVPSRLAVLDTRSVTAEAFRILQHNLCQQGAGWHVLTVTSAVPSEGKSTIVANLAVSIARTGKKVTLVDADFRRPSQHQLFGVKNSRGLYDILNGAAEPWQTYAQATPVEGLQLVTSGSLPPDPAVLLESPAFARWLEQVKSISEVVIVDTPAALGLADAAIVAQVADAVLLVVGSDIVAPRNALRAKELLATTGKPIVGVVLNRAEAMPGALTYAHYYANRKESSADGNGQGGFSSNGHGAVGLVGVRDRIVRLILPHKH